MSVSIYLAWTYLLRFCSLEWCIAVPGSKHHCWGLEHPCMAFHGLATVNKLIHGQRTLQYHYWHCVFYKVHFMNMILRSGGWQEKSRHCSAMHSLMQPRCYKQVQNLFWLHSKSVSPEPCKIISAQVVFAPMKSDVRVVTSFHRSLVEQYREADLFIVNFLYSQAMLIISF